MDFTQVLSVEFNIKNEHAENIIKLLDDGSTIPFIARYRKELTGACDDQVLRNFSDRLTYLRKLETSKDDVKRKIAEQEKLTPAIEKSINDANTLTEIEDIYRPFKPKKQTRATIAIGKGLQPLADFILSQKQTIGDKLDEAAKFINVDLGVKTALEAFKGACDIISETISDSAELRKQLRMFVYRTGKIVTSFKDVKKDEKLKEKQKTYEMYIDFSEPVNKIVSHRILAINRAENEGCLKVKIDVNVEECDNLIIKEFLKAESIHTATIKECCSDAFDRLIFPSIEREIMSSLFTEASEQAIKTFELNLKPLLLQPPLKDKVILGFDPGYRTGCKVAVINESGKVLDTTVVYATPPHSKIEESETKILQLINKDKVNVISIGNGTASKESEIFIANTIKKAPHKVEYAVVSEAGASVYSASKLGASEFPEFDVALRSAVSIARRLQDPLAELIKIDVKSIGVGQYQHDMPEKRLTEVLNGVVEDCVNNVGVELNTASPKLLSLVSGLNASASKAILDYREKNGKFKSRQELKKVPKLGEKAYEQCAGFLRINDGENILDNTSVHPESYEAVIKLLTLFNIDVKTLKTENGINLKSKIDEMGIKEVTKKVGLDEFTLNDIVNELVKPGRDIRDSLPPPELKAELLDISNIHEGMILKGTVRNVADFGAFVDLGVHQDGLIHISQICDRYIKHPSEELKVGDVVKVKVLSVDLNKNRIALTMKGDIE